MAIYIFEPFGENQERKRVLVDFVQKNLSNVIHASNTMLLTNFISTVCCSTFYVKDTRNEVKSISTPCSDMTLTGLCQLELTKNLGPLCIAIGMLIIICSLGTADKRISKSLEPMTWPKNDLKDHSRTYRAL